MLFDGLHSLTLNDGRETVDPEVPIAFLTATQPRYVEPINFFVRAQTKMEAQVIL
jgi:hypothetical protein